VSRAAAIMRRNLEVGDTADKIHARAEEEALASTPRLDPVSDFS
jgi:hypothetical protein